MTPGDVSIVIPTLNEQANIGTCIASALEAGANDIIIGDGGSQDDTAHLATESGATQIVSSSPGRGTQLRAAAAMATKPYILFLHADNLLTADCLHQICTRQPVWGAFRHQIDSTGVLYRFLETGNSLRVKYRQMPFGDQAVFVRREAYAESDGFPDVPLMEDVLFAQMMRKQARPVLLDGPIIISSRRWDERGVVRQTLRNFKIQIAHNLGASPKTLEKWYD